MSALREKQRIFRDGQLRGYTTFSFSLFFRSLTARDESQKIFTKKKLSRSSPVKQIMQQAHSSQRVSAKANR
jgi:hypothetical protein